VAFFSRFALAGNAPDVSFRGRPLFFFSTIGTAWGKQGAFSSGGEDREGVEDLPQHSYTCGLALPSRSVTQHSCHKLIIADLLDKLVDNPFRCYYTTIYKFGFSLAIFRAYFMKTCFYIGKVWN
jgi:hypothetical protein